MSEVTNPPNVATTSFVSILPDLITERDYLDSPGRQKVRVRISRGEDGVEILADSMYPALIEQLLATMGAEEIERMLCG